MGGFVVPFVVLLRCFLGVTLFCKRDSARVARLLYWKEMEKVWEATPLCLFWTLWKERNRRSFDNEEL